MNLNRVTVKLTFKSEQSADPGGAVGAALAQPPGRCSYRWAQCSGGHLAQNLLSLKTKLQFGHKDSPGSAEMVGSATTCVS